MAGPDAPGFGFCGGTSVALADADILQDLLTSLGERRVFKKPRQSSASFGETDGSESEEYKLLRQMEAPAVIQLIPHVPPPIPAMVQAVVTTTMHRTLLPVMMDCTALMAIPVMVQEIASPGQETPVLLVRSVTKPLTTVIPVKSAVMGA